jgi:hypothetical protein
LPWWAPAIVVALSTAAAAADATIAVRRRTDMPFPMMSSPSNVSAGKADAEGGP